MIAAVFHGLEAIEAQLERLGLAPEPFIKAAQAGYLARTSCTPHHPLNFPGTYHYAECVRQLRDDLVPMGWSAQDDQNMPVTVSPEGGIAIAVVSGDENTGIADRTPSTKRKRGAVTTRRVDDNQQLALELPVPDLPPKVDDDGKELRQTWVLLHFFDRRELRFELSRPVSIGDDGYIEYWKERIIFEPVPIDGVALPILPEYAEQPDVPVERKT